MTNKTISKHWEDIFAEYNILEKVKNNGLFNITANQIKEHKEPRLMAKFDTSSVLPAIFKNNNLAILPNSRNSYIIGDFALYHHFEESPKKFKHIHIPSIYETINKDSISSEAVALNALGLTGALDDFLGESNLRTTISGRMTTDDFAFNISNHDNSAVQHITVKGSQMEIDTSYENENTFVLIEAKAVIHEDFLIRQLFYPYFYWHNHVQKPIKPIFVIYVNGIYRIMEYEFRDPNNYSSINLVREQSYSLENAAVSLEEIIAISRNIKFVEENTNVPFVQADTFENVITLIEHLNNGSMTPEEVTELFDFTDRQTDYYYNAARYLGFAEKSRQINGDKLICLTEKGKGLFKVSYENRQIAFIKAILEHRIFNDAFQWAVNNTNPLDRKRISNRLLELGCCKEGVAERRASSVLHWIKWIMSVPENHE